MTINRIQVGDQVYGGIGVFYSNREAEGRVLNLLVGGEYAHCLLDDGDKAVVPVNVLTDLDR